MPLIAKFQCDNPACANEALPEDGGSHRKPATPYQWLRAVVTRQGSWTFTTTVCSVDCLQQAVEEAEAIAREHE